MAAPSACLPNKACIATLAFLAHAPSLVLAHRSPAKCLGVCAERQVLRRDVLQRALPVNNTAHVGQGHKFATKKWKAVEGAWLPAQKLARGTCTTLKHASASSHMHQHEAHNYILTYTPAWSALASGRCHEQQTPHSGGWAPPQGLLRSHGTPCVSFPSQHNTTQGHQDEKCSAHGDLRLLSGYGRCRAPQFQTFATMHGSFVLHRHIHGAWLAAQALRHTHPLDTEA